MALPSPVGAIDTQVKLFFFYLVEGNKHTVTSTEYRKGYTNSGCGTNGCTKQEQLHGKLCQQQQTAPTKMTTQI